MTTISSAPGAAGAEPDRKHNLHSSDPYEVLGVNRTASPAEIKQAYFALVRLYPPEVQPDSFKLLRTAYEKLRSAEVKAETDLFLYQPPAPWEPRRRKGKLNLEVNGEDVLRLLHTHGDLGRTDFSDDFRKPIS
jgi:curved DNA-binding protein CbpA